MTLQKMAELIKANAGTTKKDALAFARNLKKCGLNVKSTPTSHKAEAEEGYDISPISYVEIFDRLTKQCLLYDDNSTDAKAKIDKALTHPSMVVYMNFASGEVIQLQGRQFFGIKLPHCDYSGSINASNFWKDGIAYIDLQNGFSVGSDGYYHDTKTYKKLIPFADFWNAE